VNTFNLLLQVTPPKTALPPEWNFWIIITLITAVITLVGCVKWIVSKVEKGVAVGWLTLQENHTEAIDQLKDNHTELEGINKSLVKHDKRLTAIERDNKETKYAIQRMPCNPKKAVKDETIQSA